ncbi:hypothetical protein Daus18300_006192 [Diaporthe australafricana]|uniref:Uncharacterized protein n=1 Tax=Diaporthe australafricana TaxID=127596 RepID=A0ABR3WW72_9PEZI
MSHAQAALDPELDSIAGKPSNPISYQHQPAAERPQSLGLPLRMRDGDWVGPDKKKNLRRSTTHPVRASSVSFRPASNRVFEIAASILREGYGVKAAKTTVPLKVQDAVHRCLQEVSTTVQEEHSRWALPQYRSGLAADSDAQSRTQPSDHEASANRARYGVSSGDDEDPFAYDNSKESLYQKLYGFGKGGRGMKARLLDASTPYSCPFRKRDPVMFNVREHEHCAKRPFFGMTELK